MLNNRGAFNALAGPYSRGADDIKAAGSELIEKISANANLPAFGSSVSKVVQLASSDDEAVRSLAHFIMSDVGLTQKILRISNAACYRSTASTPVTTISKAIFLLGFDTVKTSALGMMLVDRMSGSRAAGVRTELLHALSASIFGRELARRSQEKDAEEAAIAALFKNLGRLLVASHDHALYAEINTLTAQGMAPAKAASQVIGCTYDMLAETVMAEWGIPESIIHAMAPLPARALRPAKTRQEWVQQVAAFSSAAAEMVMQPADTDAAAQAIVMRFGVALSFDQAKLAQMLATVTEETRALAGQMKLAVVPVVPKIPLPSSVSSLWSQLENDDFPETGGRGNQDLPAELLLGVNTEDDPLQISARHPSGKPVNARDLLLAGVQDVTEMMASGRCKVNDLMMLVLETLYRSMGFRFATVCLKDIKTHQFRSRISLGENNAARQSGFMFSANASRDLFHLAMANNADLLISDAQEAKIRHLIPLWHKVLLPDARSFIVLPLIAQNKPIGLFYADRAMPATEGVPTDETAMIKTLKGQVIAALNSRT